MFPSYLPIEFLPADAWPFFYENQYLLRWLALLLLSTTVQNPAARGAVFFFPRKLWQLFEYFVKAHGI